MLELRQNPVGSLKLPPGLLSTASKRHGSAPLLLAGVARSWLQLVDVVVAFVGGLAISVPMALERLVDGDGDDLGLGRIERTGGLAGHDRLADDVDLGRGRRDRCSWEGWAAG